MDTRNNNRYRMLVVLVAFFESRRSDKTWTAIPALARAVADLKTASTRVGEILEEGATADGSSASKIACLDALILQVLPIAASLHAYAVDQSDVELETQTAVSESDFRRSRESAIVAKCSRILSLAKEHVDELEDYDIEQADLTVLEKKIQAFASACPKPRQNVATKSAATKALPTLFRHSRQIIDKRIEKLMVKFKESAPDFYNEYRTARRIVAQPGTQGKQKATSPVVLPAPAVSKAA